jgi:photosystem II stability/assembly factor-like uncharacterized protein
MMQCATAQQEKIYMAVLSIFPTRHETGRQSMAGLLVSSDQGETWQHQGWQDYIRTFYSEEGSDGTIWSACGNGVLRSMDDGKTWKVTTGWEVTEVLKVKAAESEPTLVLAATAYGIFRSTNGGSSWEKTIDGLRRPFSEDVCIDRTDPRRILAATEEGVYLSHNKGGTWAAAGLEGQGVRVIVQDPHIASRFWLGTEKHGVFWSTTAGRRWEPRSHGLHHHTVYSIALDPARAGVLYAGTWNGGVYKSTNNGALWKQCSRGLTDLDVHSLIVLSSDPKRLLAGTLNRGLFGSTNGGASWQYLTQDDSQVWGLSVRFRKHKED